VPPLPILLSQTTYHDPARRRAKRRSGDATHAADPTWTPLLVTPPHPEYPSGHQFTAGAYLRTLQAALGKDKVSFGLSAVEVPEAGVRTYTSLSQAANESRDSRTFAGVHFAQSNADGQEIGVKIAESVLARFSEL
jgi:hypothetical protein